MFEKRGNRLAQTTIFIIIAVVIVAAVILVLLLRVSKDIEKVPFILQDPYNSFLSCLEDTTLTGVKLLESQGGYINLPAYEPGSLYMPFSSQLDFAGIKIPYWYYVSGNNIQKQQIPLLSNMQLDLSNFIKDQVSRCNLDSYIGQGYSINRGKPSVRAIVRDSEVQVNMNMDLSISKDSVSSIVKDHQIILKTKLGQLYTSALEAYNLEQKELFLEKYGLDAMRLYAPVDGVELKCSPLIWNADKIFDDLENAIEANTLALKSQGKKDDYFLVDGLNGNARFINSKNWARSLEVDPSEGPLLIASPVGNQPGLGVLGFCYIPYHFVYNLKYPVLVQVYDGKEIFQFPVAVVIRGNKAREALSASGVQDEIPDFCKYKNTVSEVGVYDLRNKPVDADITYDCAGTSCYIGKTENGKLRADFPQCVNGRITARAEGYEDAKETYSSVDSGRTNILISKIQTLNVDFRLDERVYSGSSIISFVSNESSKTIVYPDQKTIDLIPGEYEVQVYVYKNSSLTLGSSVTQQCVDVPNGVLGIIGITKKRCFDIEIPEQIISNALSGGGKQNYYVSQSQLENSKTVQINAESLPVPTSIDQLQINYILFEEKNLGISFR